MGKKSQIEKLAQNQPKSGKRLKPKTIPSFLGYVGLIKVEKEFLRAPEVPFFCIRIWALLPKVPIFTWPKMALRVPERKFFDHFYKSNITQK